jgi:hypothetical protein
MKTSPPASVCRQQAYSYATASGNSAGAGIVALKNGGEPTPGLNHPANKLLARGYPAGGASSNASRRWRSSTWCADKPGR